MTCRMMKPPMLTQVAVSVILALAAVAEARRPGLSLGTPRAIGAGIVAVPVRLRAPAGQPVAALNFSVRYDPAQLEVVDRGVMTGATVRRANAQLTSRTDAARGTVTAIVLPAFRRDFPALRGWKIATLRLRPRGAMPRRLKKWVQRHVRLEGVVLGDPEGREVRFDGIRRGGRS